MAIQAINAVSAIAAADPVTNGMVASIDTSIIDQIPSNDNVFSGIGEAFVDMINELRSSQFMLTALSQNDNVATPQNLMRVQYIMDDYDNSLIMASTVIKQVNKALDTLVHIQ